MSDKDEMIYRGLLQIGSGILWGLIIGLFVLGTNIPTKIQITVKQYEQPEPFKWEWWDKTNENARKLLQGEAE